MKKIFLTVIVVLLAVTTVSAQYKGDWGVGPKIGVYTNAGADGAIFGIGAAGQYSITDNWRVAPSILALCKTDCSVDISADVQYLFNIAPDWHIYPLAGISANDIGDWSCGINPVSYTHLRAHETVRRRRGLLDHPQLGRFGRLQMDDPDRQGLCTRLCEAQEPHRYQYRRDVQVLSPIPRGNKIPALIRKCRDFSCPQPRSRLSRAG